MLTYLEEYTTMRRSLWIGVFIFLLVACAQERPITGGDIDREGPVVQAIFPPNFSLNFSSPTIEVEFDEYIVLNDFQSQLIVSPPLTKRPDVQVKNKTLVLTFKEKLKDNTTYSFQFGEGIKDYTEGNIAQNIQIVMSTGAVMDSLSICGTLKSAYSTEPISGAKVMLYRGLADSLPQTQKPDYMSLTNEDGSFCVAYMSAGDYSLVAVQDEDANYLYDEGENMAFFSDRIQLSEASQTDSSLVLWASRERAKEIFISAYFIDSLGNMKMVFNESRVQPLLDVLESETDDYQVIYPNAADDTLRFWSTNPYLRNTEFRVEVQVDSVVLDTIYLLDNDEGLKTIQTDKTPAKRDWQRGIDFQFDHLLD